MPGRILLVSPTHPAVNAADNQRVRMMLPYLPEFGWQPRVMAIPHADLDPPGRPDLAATLPPGLDVSWVKPFPRWLFRGSGLHSPVFRAWIPMFRQGLGLIRSRQVDLVFFSNTGFVTFALGPLWKRWAGCPYVLDFHDPWVSDYAYSNEHPPPGGWRKYRIMQWLARRLEPTCVRAADHIIAVSGTYLQDFRRRYGVDPRRNMDVVVFPGHPPDFANLDTVPIRAYSPDDGKRHVVFIGRGGLFMRRAAEVLFGTLRELRRQEPQLPWDQLRLHFIGTNYAPGEPPTFVALAERFAVADLVEEQTARIPFFEAMAGMRASHGVLILGNSDAGYSPSKLFSCVLSRRPILAVLHRASLVAELIREFNCGEVIGFDEQTVAESPNQQALHALRRFLTWPREVPAATRWDRFEPYSSRAMTKQLCTVFDAIQARRRRVERPAF
jgi:glycosyltransferase involved in cell wall biosynthesis